MPAGDEEAAGETDWGNLDNDCTSSHAHKCSYLVGEIGNVFKLVGGGTSQNDSEGAETAPSNLQASKDIQGYNNPVAFRTTQLKEGHGEQ